MSSENDILTEAEIIEESTTPPSPEKKRGGVWGGVFPTAVDLLAILGVFLVSQLVALGATYALGFGYDRLLLDSPNEVIRETTQFKAGMFSLVSYSIIMTITILGTLIIRAFRGGKAPVAKFSYLGFNPSVLLWGMIMLICIAIIFDPLMRMLPTPPQMYGRGWAMILTLLVVAPLAEEFLCRGLILESVRAKGGVWAACIISSLFFAVLHFHPTAAVNALIVGMMLAYLYIRTNSLFAPIILHSFNNALAFMLVWLGFENVTLWEIVGNKMVYAILYGVAVVTLITSMIKIIRQLTRIRKAQELSTEG